MGFAADRRAVSVVTDPRLRARAAEAEAVRLSEKRFRSRVVATSQIVWTTSPSGESEGEQPGWSAFTGQSPEEYRGLGWFDAVHSDDRASTIEVWSTALRERRPYELEHRLRRSDGEYRHMWVRGVPVLEEDGRVREWIGIHADITEEKRAEEERDRTRAEAERLATERDAVLRQVADGVIFTDPEGRIVFVNEAARRMHGVAEIGVPVEDYTKTYHLLTLAGEPYPPEELPLARAVRGETVTDAEWRIRRPDGTEILAQGSATPVVAEDGRTLGAVLTLHDVTAERRLQHERQTERMRLHEIFAKVPALISVTRGPEHVFELVNPFYQRMVGDREMVGKPLREALPELAGQGFFEMRDTVYATGETHVRNEARILADLDGDGQPEEHFLNFVTQPLRDAEGRVEGLLTFAAEVTEQVRARQVVEELAGELEAHTEELQSQAILLEEMQAELEMSHDELSAAEGRLRGIFDSALDAMMVTDTESVILEWNHHAETIFGWSAEEALGKSLAETIIPPRYREAHQKGIERYLATGEGPILNRRIEIPALRRDGGEFPVELTVAPSRVGGRILFTAFIRDITERRAAERRVAAEHAVTRVLAESHTLEKAAPEILHAIGASLGWETGVLWTVDPAANALVFAEIWHAPGAPVPEFTVAEEQLRFAPGAGLPGRVWESGAPAWIRDVTRDPNFPRADVAARVGLHGAFAFPVRGGDEFLGVIEFFHREALAPDPGLLASVEAIGRDVGQSIQRIRAEEERDRALDAIVQMNAALVARTAEAEAANQAKSHFLANMSHELRTPINAVVGYAELLDMGIAGPVTEAQQAQLARIGASSRHLIGLIDDILDLAKVEAGRMDVAHESARTMDAITAALSLVAPQATARGITIEDSCAEDRGASYTGDEDRVRQVLANLLSNAVKFTEPGGRIRVTCGTTAEPDPEAQLRSAGTWAYVRVEDTGIGIAPEDLAAVFEPFVQAERGHTRTRGGTGLGLTISRRLARLMVGDLTARSVPGAGSVFTLWLPTGSVPGGSLEEAVLAEVRGTGSGPRGLARIGEAVQGEIDSILRAYVARLRADPLVPNQDTRTDADLEDHTSSFLANIAQSLVILEQTGGKPELMRDCSEIQRLISERHGAQRARLGWTEEALRREFEILKEEVEAAVRRNIPSESGVDVDVAVAVLVRFLDHAERISQLGLRVAAGASTV